MKKFLCVLAVAVASVTLTVPAAQANPPCVTKREARHVHAPMSMAKVRGIFDTNGSVRSHHGQTVVRAYRPCRGLHSVSVSYRNGKMFKKVVF